MYASVRQAFSAFSKQFEGRMSVMYLDTHTPPLVTIGVGNLIDPLPEALKLPFQWKQSAKAATPQEITAEWTRIKSLTQLAQNSASIWNTVTRLCLSEDAIDALIHQRLSANEALLKRRLPFVNYEVWPADAQLALHSMAWAMGPGFKFPLFELSMMRRDFAAAAQHCKMNDANNAGLTPRNKVNRQLFLNASQVDAQALIPASLYYPKAL